MSRQARALDTLVAEINHFAPNRNKISDGGKASPAHNKQNIDSDHNPDNPNHPGVWTAFDVTNDPVGKPPTGGDDMPGAFLARKLDALLGHHPAMMEGAYIIWDHRIKSYNRRDEGWRPYVGDPHTGHVHLSVSSAKFGYDSTKPWNLFEDAPTGVDRMRSYLAQAIAEGEKYPDGRIVIHNVTDRLKKEKLLLPPK